MLDSKVPFREITVEVREVPMSRTRGSELLGSRVAVEATMINFDELRSKTYKIFLPLWSRALRHLCAFAVYTSIWYLPGLSMGISW